MTRYFLISWGRWRAVVGRSGVTRHFGGDRGYGVWSIRRQGVTLDA